MEGILARLRFLDIQVYIATVESNQLCSLPCITLVEYAIIVRLYPHPHGGREYHELIGVVMNFDGRGEGYELLRRRGSLAEV